MTTKNSDGIIGVLCAVGLSAIATYAVTQYVQTKSELEKTQIEYRGYQEGVKDSQ